MPVYLGTFSVPERVLGTSQRMEEYSAHKPALRAFQVWDPGAAWIAGGPFSLTDVRAYFEDGVAALQTPERRLPWFWFDEAERVVYVDKARLPGDVTEDRLRAPLDQRNEPEAGLGR